MVPGLQSLRVRSLPFLETPLFLGFFVVGAAFAPHGSLALPRRPSFRPGPARGPRRLVLRAPCPCFSRSLSGSHAGPARLLSGQGAPSFVPAPAGGQRCLGPPARPVASAPGYPAAAARPAFHPDARGASHPARRRPHTPAPSARPRGPGRTLVRSHRGSPCGRPGRPGGRGHAGGGGGGGGGARGGERAGRALLTGGAAAATPGRAEGGAEPRGGEAETRAGTRGCERAEERSATDCQAGRGGRRAESEGAAAPRRTKGRGWGCRRLSARAWNRRRPGPEESAVPGGHGWLRAGSAAGQPQPGEGVRAGVRGCAGALQRCGPTGAGMGPGPARRGLPSPLQVGRRAGSRPPALGPAPGLRFLGASSCTELGSASGPLSRRRRFPQR